MSAEEFGASLLQVLGSLSESGLVGIRFDLAGEQHGGVFQLRSGGAQADQDAPAGGVALAGGGRRFPFLGLALALHGCLFLEHGWECCGRR